MLRDNKKADYRDPEVSLELRSMYTVLEIERESILFDADKGIGSDHLLEYGDIRKSLTRGTCKMERYNEYILR